jgi:putative nucleotidyltransferase with HDIG domain
VRAPWTRRRQPLPAVGPTPDAPALQDVSADVEAPAGLVGETAFRARLDEEFARAERHGRALAVIVFGVDAEAAREPGFVDRMRAALRPGSLLARLSETELALLVPEADGMDGYAAAERLRRAVGPACAIAAGVCDLEQALAPDDLLRLARASLQHALADGGNRIWRYSSQVAAEIGVESPLRSQSLAGIRALARAIDHKDASTIGHSDGVAAMAGALAAELGWPAPEIERLELAALVHDVGKMGVPDGTLLKPSLLTPAEHSHVQLHAALGAQIAAEVLAADQVAWVRSHHERIDGTGYPDGLAGDAIPLGARIIAVADAWDVMTSGRPYAAPLEIEEALAECLRVVGSQLDVTIVDALVRVLQARHRDERDIA